MGRFFIFLFKVHFICTINNEKKIAFGSLIYIRFGMCISESRYTGNIQL
jgi:hypothetical protein